MPAMKASRLARCRLRRGVRVAPATVRSRRAASPTRRCGGCGDTPARVRRQSRWCSGASAMASRITGERHGRTGSPCAPACRPAAGSATVASRPCMVRSFFDDQGPGPLRAPPRGRSRPAWPGPCRRRCPCVRSSRARAPAGQATAGLLGAHQHGGKRLVVDEADLGHAVEHSLGHVVGAVALAQLVAQLLPAARRRRQLPQHDLTRDRRGRRARCRAAGGPAPDRRAPSVVGLVGRAEGPPPGRGR